MARGETTQAKLHYKGNNEDFLIFVDDVEQYKKWLNDKSVPLAHFVSSFQIFVTHGQGAQGTYDTASKSILDAEFGTTKEDDVVKVILEKGNIKNMEMPERQGSKNDSNGGMVAH